LIPFPAASAATPATATPILFGRRFLTELLRSWCGLHLVVLGSRACWNLGNGGLLDALTLRGKWRGRRLGDRDWFLRRAAHRWLGSCIRVQAKEEGQLLPMLLLLTLFFLLFGHDRLALESIQRQPRPITFHPHVYYARKVG
jgi:hypothetical protein